MYNRKQKKISWEPVVLALLFCVIAGMTTYAIVAWFMDADNVTNVVRAGSIETVVEEEFNPPDEILKGVPYTKNVKIKNVGEAPCFVRVKVEFSDSMAGDYCTLDYNTADWEYNTADGYYYYKYPLTKNELTSSLFASVTLNDASPKESMTDFDILIYQESYQSNGFGGDYREAWADYYANKPETDMEDSGLSE